MTMDAAEDTTTTTMKVPVASIPRLYLGTMSFGWSQTSAYVDEAIAKNMVDRFVKVNHDLFGTDDLPRMDTARIYAGGKTETICGSIMRSDNMAASVALGTKAHPSQLNGLSRNGIQAQLEASKAACRVDSFAEYYLHQPDTKHDLLSSLQYLHELVQDGTIQRIGMSNYHYLEMKRAFELCREHHLTPPTVYQGLYNPLNRMAETELMPLLRQHGCAFVAYNPLAAGLLTGKHQSANFEALDIIQKQCHKDEISLVDATYLWLLQHSALTANDGVLVGASSLKQLDENLQACYKAAAPDAKLSPELLEAFERAHEVIKRAGAFPYWRSYSADMPDRERLDQGAAYEATKK
ncbi:hypothetical protein MPSEU_000283500 [Mayamaea pseudoterrestris]|nr:hypothetical protein MPSEU_000283500 [Mayamaea pseudoterrestris]